MNTLPICVDNFQDILSLLEGENPREPENRLWEYAKVSPEWNQMIVKKAKSIQCKSIKNIFDHMIKKMPEQKDRAESLKQALLDQVKSIKELNEIELFSEQLGMEIGVFLKGNREMLWEVSGQLEAGQGLKPEHFHPYPEDFNDLGEERAYLQRPLFYKKVTETMGKVNSAYFHVLISNSDPQPFLMEDLIYFYMGQLFARFHHMDYLLDFTRTFSVTNPVRKEACLRAFQGVTKDLELIDQAVKVVDQVEDFELKLDILKEIFDMFCQNQEWSKAAKVASKAISMQTGRGANLGLQNGFILTAFTTSLLTSQLSLCDTRTWEQIWNEDKRLLAAPLVPSAVLGGLGAICGAGTEIVNLITSKPKKEIRWITTDGKDHTLLL